VDRRRWVFISTTRHHREALARTAPMAAYGAIAF